MTCPTCTDPMHGIQYALTPCDYDGVSEWVCPRCRIRIGRWSGLTLGEGELESRYGVDSPYKMGIKSAAVEQAFGEGASKVEPKVNTGARWGEEWLD